MTRAFVLGVALLMAAPVGAGELDALKQQLNGENDARAEEAARKLGELADPKALDAMLDALSVGAPPKVQATLLASLSGKKDPRAVEVLVAYAKNRNPELRKKSVNAIAELPPGDKRVVPVLLEALSDSVEEVRATAATALGKRKERQAEGALVKLLQRNDQAAANALAQMATPELAHKLSEMLGQVPDALLCSVLGDMLKRPDFGPEPIRVEVVKTLSKVPGIDSTSALIEYVATSGKDPKEKMRPSRVEAQKIVDQRSSN